MTNIRHPAKSMGAQWRGRNGDPMVEPYRDSAFYFRPSRLALVKREEYP